MDRKNFLKKTGGGLFCMAASPVVLGSTLVEPAGAVQQRQKYSLEIEIYEAREYVRCPDPTSGLVAKITRSVV
ncbi:MAG TPA: hypothetical protein VMW76_07055 [Bacteroidales bacterium]|nr:hypothetical protein [Bacteroidales bacterium]